VGKGLLWKEQISPPCPSSGRQERVGRNLLYHPLPGFRRSEPLPLFTLGFSTWLSQPFSITKHCSRLIASDTLHSSSTVLLVINSRY
jgi:hypothetical protein